MAKMTLENMIFAFDLEPEGAIKYFKSKDIDMSENWADTLAKIKKDCFLITGVTKMNLLMEARDLILQALEGEIPHDVFKRKIQEAMNLRAWHADLVISQNLSNSFNAGRLELQDEGKKNFPYLRPIIQVDKKTSKSCLYLYTAKICLRTDDPYLRYFYSPRHFRCRTIWIAINEKMRVRMGLKVVKAITIPEQYRNQKEFQRLPTMPFQPDLSGYPKNLKKHYNKELVEV